MATWINIKEALPQQSGPVLAWLDDSFGVGLTQIKVTFFSTETRRFEADDDFETVTHWMLLPAGPTASDVRDCQ